MAIEWIQVSLSAWDARNASRRVGEMIPHRSVAERLWASECDAVLEINEKDTVGLTTGIKFAHERASKYVATEDPQEALSAALSERLTKATAWLDERPLGIFDEMRREGLTIDVNIYAWINEEQLNLTLPPQFLHTCGRLGLRISLCTND